MRAALSMLGLLVVAAIVGLLAKHQWSAPPSLPTVPGAMPAASGALGTSPAQQSQQLQQQYKQALDEAMRPARPTGDEAQ